MDRRTDGRAATLNAAHTEGRIVNSGFSFSRCVLIMALSPKRSVNKLVK